MITLNAIAKRLEQFGTNHFFIKSYSFGSPDDVDLDKFQDFPLMHVVYTGSDYDERTKTFSFEVYVFDRPNREEQMTINQREVVSDAQQCLEDVIADIANGGNIFLFDEDYEVTTAGITPLIDERSNLLTGALLDLTIQVPYQRDACNLPIDGVSPEGGAIAYQRRGILRVLTQDGTTDVPSVNTIKVTNGTLTDEGDGVVSIDTGGVDILGDLENVNLDDPQDHEALVYDEDTATWINGASTKIGIRVINQTGVALFKASPVKVVGVQGDQLKVDVFRATDDPKYFVGMLADEIANGETGYARQTGMIYGLDTSGFEVGDILYPRKEFVFLLGGDGLGYMVNERPVDFVRLAKIPAAIVVRKHENTGRVYVRTWSPGFSMADLRDVVVVNPQENQVLRYDSANQTWTNAEFLPSLNDLRDVDVDNPENIPNKSLLRWDSSASAWRVIPETGGTIPALPNNIAYFLGRYNDDASTARQAADVTLTIERYLSVQADGHGEEVSAQTDTPTSGNKIVRKIWHKAVSFEDSDVSTWTLVHTFADDTAYNDTIATFNALLTAATYGSIPLTLAQTWEDVAAFTGLLDTYTGAAAAYSLRLLDSTYTSDAIRVRRASDNAEQDIGFADNELDTSALATFCAGTNGFVKTWYDQSGNANDATQTTAANQPKIYDSVTGVVTEGSAGNEKPAVSFDVDWLLMNSTVEFNSDFTIVNVNTIKENTSGYVNMITGEGSNSFFTTNPTAQSIRNEARQEKNDYTLSVANDTQSIVMLTENQSTDTQTLGINGTTQSTDSFSGGNGFWVAEIGNYRNNSTYGRRAPMQELIFWASNLESDRTDIESNINTFYSIY